MAKSKTSRRPRRAVTRKYEVQRKRVPTNYQLNRKIKKLQTDEELKYVERYFTRILDDDKTTSGQAYQLDLVNGVAVGANATSRVGNQIRATSLHIRYSIQVNPAFPTTTPPNCRIVIFWDRQANQALPELYGATNSASLLHTTVAPPIYAQTNVNNWKRYKLLYDKVHVLEPYDIQSPVVAVRNNYFKKKIKLNRIIQYDDSTGDNTAISTNALWVAAFSTAPYSATDIYKPVLHLCYRFYYKDD